MEIIVITGLIFFIISLSLLSNIRTKKKYTNINRNQSITQESYQRYAKFYEHAIPEIFYLKRKWISSINQLLMRKKET